MFPQALLDPSLGALPSQCGRTELSDFRLGSQVCVAGTWPGGWAKLCLLAGMCFKKHQQYLSPCAGRRVRLILSASSGGSANSPRVAFLPCSPVMETSSSLKRVSPCVGSAALSGPVAGAPVWLIQWVRVAPPGAVGAGYSLPARRRGLWATLEHLACF